VRTPWRITVVPVALDVWADESSTLQAGRCRPLPRLLSAVTKPHGMGLGLAISRSIIEAHGGRLWGVSNRRHGAVFSFRLPAGETG